MHLPRPFAVLHECMVVCSQDVLDIGTCCSLAVKECLAKAWPHIAASITVNALSDPICAGEHGSSVLEQLVDALHGGLERLQQAAAFCRVRAYLSMESLVAAVASARGNVGTCLQGTSPSASCHHDVIL